MKDQEHATAVLLENQLALTAYFASVTRSYHLAEDVFQEVCIAAISQKSGFESDKHLIHWARMCGRNRSIDTIRARSGKYVALSDDVLVRLACAMDEALSSSNSSRQDALRECISELTANSREILRLRYFEGWTSSVVAEILQRKVETVYQSIARIHKTLAECIDQKLSQPEAGR